MSHPETHPSPVDVTPVIEHNIDGTDTHLVQIALRHHAMREVVQAVARAYLTGRIYTHMLIAAGQTGTAGMDAANAVARAVGMGAAPVWDLSPDDATALGHALLESAEEPRPCDHCGRLVDLLGEAECGTCQEIPGRW